MPADEQEAGTTAGQGGPRAAEREASIEDTERLLGRHQTLGNILPADGEHPPGEKRAGEAAGLPPRVAHVLHALMARWADRGEAVTAAEVCEYDSEALNVRHTVAGLMQARRLGLADNLAPGLWGATEQAWAMRAALEQRFRAEVPDA